jgi:hypothetical protein
MNIIGEGDIVRKFVFLLLLLTFACSKAPVEDNSIVDVLTLDETCESSDKCCEDACKALCKDNNLAYTKHTPNGNQCGCWCD